jgi:hypothetical protein
MLNLKQVRLIRGCVTLSDKDADKIVKKYRGGTSISRLSDQYGQSYDTIFRLVKKHESQCS